jgi:hypothetical protein
MDELQPELVKGNLAESPANDPLSPSVLLVDD